MSPENTNYHRERARQEREQAERQHKLIPRIVDVVKTRLGIHDEELDGPAIEVVPSSLHENIEADLQRFRDEKKGSAQADMITPLTGMEDISFYVVRNNAAFDQDGYALDHGTLEGGWKVSAASEEDGISLFKPEVDDNGEISIKSKNLPVAEFNRLQDLGAKAEEGGGQLDEQRAKRIVALDYMMNKMKNSPDPDWNKPDDLK